MSKSKGRKVLKKHKTLDKIWHPESTLVFKSASEKLVIGRVVDDDFVSLDDEALDACEEWGFKFDPSLVESDDDEGEDVSASDPPDTEVDDSDVDSEQGTEPEPEPESEPEPDPEPAPEEDNLKNKEKEYPLQEHVSKEGVIDGGEVVNSMFNQMRELVNTYEDNIAFLQGKNKEYADKLANLEKEHTKTKTELAQVTAKFTAVKNLFN